jgi:hypothetical protein
LSASGFKMCNKCYLGPQIKFHINSKWVSNIAQFNSDFESGEKAATKFSEKNRGPITETSEFFITFFSIKKILLFCYLF